jgi:hypothetical protein
VRHALFNVTDCTFIGNTMIDTALPQDGGGGIFISANGEHEEAEEPAYVTGTISGCDFIGNTATRGGGIYVHSAGWESQAKPLHVKDCRFIANGNANTKAGGGMGIGDPTELEETDVRICKSVFVSNKGWKGGAIHNHEGALTYMVNCRLAGNESTEEGGGIFNSRHTGGGLPAEINLHNCLIAGNIADGTGSADRGGGVFNGFENSTPLEPEATMEMVHCTLLGNYAGASYGGAVNVVSNSTMRFYNSISRDNADADGGTGDFAENLFHEAGYEDSPHDADAFVAEGTLPSIYNPSSPPTWTANDPAFIDNGSGSISWTAASYDPDTGLTTFTTTNTSGAAVNELFKPSTSNVRMLVIESVVANTSVTCWGYWANGSGTAKLFDLQIQDSGSAYEFADAAYIASLTSGGCGDRCDLNGNSQEDEALPYDLFGNGRNLNSAPDAGIHEVPASSFGGGG